MDGEHLFVGSVAQDVFRRVLDDVLQLAPLHLSADRAASLELAVQEMQHGDALCPQLLLGRHDFLHDPPPVDCFVILPGFQLQALGVDLADELLEGSGLFALRLAACDGLKNSPCGGFVRLKKGIAGSAALRASACPSRLSNWRLYTHLPYIFAS